mmetsp:Transcript_98784/g.205907  ORF Transcript_98784/g.205907 Transcript_98784/m.205907 type:complete len:255 (+) Transcript_98784:1478-2242(+)
MRENDAIPHARQQFPVVLHQHLMTHKGPGNKLLLPLSPAAFSSHRFDVQHLRIALFPSETTRNRFHLAGRGVAWRCSIHLLRCLHTCLSCYRWLLGLFLEIDASLPGLHVHRSLGGSCAAGDPILLPHVSSFVLSIELLGLLHERRTEPFDRAATSSTCQQPALRWAFALHELVVELLPQKPHFLHDRPFFDLLGEGRSSERVGFADWDRSSIRVAQNLPARRRRHAPGGGCRWSSRETQYLHKWMCNTKNKGG